MVFRLQCKCFYGTWPQCEVSAQDCLDGALRVLPPCEWAVVAKEAHKDGTPHLHGIFYFKEKCDIKDANPILDMICMKHGNYQGAKSPKKVLRYVCKDNNYVTFGDVPSWKEEKVLDHIARELMAGKTYEDIKATHPGICLLHKRKIEEFESECSRKRLDTGLQVWVPPVYTGGDWNIDIIVNWLRENIRMPRKHRQQQLFIYGPTGTGKSRLIWQLSHFLKIYHMPRVEDYYDSWENSYYDLAVLDEFKSNKTIQWLNSWLDGHVMPLKKKCVTQVLKMQNIPTILLSNLTFEENYKKDSLAREALRSRFVFAHVEFEFNLFPSISE